MFDLTCRQASAEIRQQSELDGIVAKLGADGYAPLVGSVIAGIADVAILRRAFRLQGPLADQRLELA